MKPEQSPRQCAACQELEPSFTLTVIKDNVFRRLCPDCLLKEHRNLFCVVCLDVFVALPRLQDTKICRFCSSTAHLSCAPPPPSSSSSFFSDHLFTCPPCLDPSFSFFPKHLATSSDDDDGSQAVLDKEKAMALVAAAEIAVASAKKAEAQLREEAVKKSIELADAKKKAKEALLVCIENDKEKASGKITPRKRKASDRR